MIYKDIQDIHSSMEREEHMKKYFTKNRYIDRNFYKFSKKIKQTFV